MSIEVKKHGEYETFETSRHHTILVLDDRDYYAMIDTARGHLMVRSDSDHEKARTLNRGDYVLFTPHDERELNDNVDHLELREGSRYRELILPNGLPTDSDKQKKLVESGESPDAEKIRKLTEKK